MGWTFGWGNLRALINDRIKGWKNINAKTGLTVESVCIAKCFRGNPLFSGTLWMVWEQTFTKDGVETNKKCFIECDLLRCTGGEWGYKDMEESMHPYYYNCPMKYLSMTPVECPEWREGVQEYHRKRREKLQQRQVA